MADKFDVKKHFDKQSDGTYKTKDGKWIIHQNSYSKGFNASPIGKDGRVTKENQSALTRFDTIEQVWNYLYTGKKMTKAQLKVQLAAQGITVRGNFVKKSEIRAFIAKAANTHELVKKMADKAHVSEEKLEHYLLGGPGSKDPTFTKELHNNTGMPDNWESIDDLDAWMAKMGLNSREILKMFKAAQSSVATADEEHHISPDSFPDIIRHLSNAIVELSKASDLVEDHHQQIEALSPKFRDHAKKAFQEIKKDIEDLGEHLGGSKMEATVAVIADSWRTDQKGTVYKTYVDTENRDIPELEAYITKKGSYFNWEVIEEGDVLMGGGEATSLADAKKLCDKVAAKSSYMKKKHK